MRAAARRWLETALVAGGGARLAARMRVARSVVLAYHDIAPDHAPRAGDSSLHLPRNRFAEHLDALRRFADVVPLDVLLRGSRQRSGRPRVAITFDDAYAGAVTDGVREVVARGMPATIFVAPGLLGSRACWWDALADPVAGEVDPELRERLLAELNGLDAPITEWAMGARIRVGRVPSHARIATVGDLEAAARMPGITIGSHSWSHASLDRLSPDALRDELRRPFDWLRERFSSFRPWLAYPYGIRSPAVASAARAAGYEAAFGIAGVTEVEGWAPAFEFARANVPAGMTAHGLALRVVGVLGTR
ncbi:MAG TPA: polysaccharide deacetylase family protein [Longimicrobiales bacterium]|nr:polysaccharide deacetylase family protein [Longimicrobiales bacterium]